MRGSVSLVGLKNDRNVSFPLKQWSDHSLSRVGLISEGIHSCVLRLLVMMSFILPGCNCSGVGAVSNVCNNVTGYCDCQPYVTGKSCDRCEQNAYNYTKAGCLPCNCNLYGSTDLQCDSVSNVQHRCSSDGNIKTKTPAL